MNVTTRDFPVAEDAFLHGYTHTLVTDVVSGKPYPTLSIQCVNNGVHEPRTDDPADKRFFSVWARDLYWGFLGWSQAGDDSVLARMKSSLELLIDCKNRNKADGHVKAWPLNDGRFYVPQAFTIGGKIADDFFPYCSESQADFLLLAHHYWRMTGDTEFIRKIWGDIVYVTETIELMDTNGNSLPDNLWGSYDYQGMGQDTEEALMSAKAYAAYRGVSEMAGTLREKALAVRLKRLAGRVKRTMNLPVAEGGLWKPLPDGGYYVNRRGIAKGKEGIDEQFIPYENLVPMFCGVTNESQNRAIFRRLDGQFDNYYNLKWGPMYTAPAIKNQQSVMDCSSTPWLGFLDVYVRCKLGHTENRSEIMTLLVKHAYDVPAAPFAEGAGIIGALTNNSGRSWDNGNFFHCLINGIYGIEKSKSGIVVKPPAKLNGFPLTELTNVRWRDAVYDLTWEGEGPSVESVMVDGKLVRSCSDWYLLKADSGKHQVTIKLGIR